MKPPATTDTQPATDAPTESVFAELQRGRGREAVSDDNVDALIELARQAGDAQLELLLREWRSPCGDDPEAPRLPDELPPPRGQ